MADLRRGFAQTDVDVAILIFEFVEAMLLHEGEDFGNLGEVGCGVALGLRRAFFWLSLHSSSISSRLAQVRYSAPVCVTRASSSMRMPPVPSTYTPGSRVTTMPARKMDFSPRPKRGIS